MSDEKRWTIHRIPRCGPLTPGWRMGPIPREIPRRGDEEEIEVVPAEAAESKLAEVEAHCKAVEVEAKEMEEGTIERYEARLAEVEGERDEWKGRTEPDISPGDVIAAEPDGTITLDDGITTWNPSRAVAFLVAEQKARADKAEADLARAQEGLLSDKAISAAAIASGMPGFGSIRAAECRTRKAIEAALTAASPAQEQPRYTVEARERLEKLRADLVDFGAPEYRDGYEAAIDDALAAFPQPNTPTEEGDGR